MSSTAPEVVSLTPMLVPIVGVVVGAVLTGAIAYFTNHKQREYLKVHEQKKLNISRLEETYKILGELRDYTNKLIIEMANSVTGARPMSADNIQRVSTDRLELLSNLYLTELVEDTESLKNKFTELTKYLAHYCIDKEADENEVKKYVRQAHNAARNINESIQLMKEKVIKQSNTVNSIT